MGRHDRRSCVAGSHVSQERALYCSSTNLFRHTKEIQVLFIMEMEVDILASKSKTKMTFVL